MNYKRLMAIVFIVAMLGMILPVIPVSSHIPCATKFALSVEGIFPADPEAPLFYKTYGAPLEEPTYGYGSTFEVEVWIHGAEDMFAYQFSVGWTDIDYIDIVDVEINEEIWPDQITVKPTIDDLYYLYVYQAQPYVQAVSALAPSTGVTGDFKLATLTFEITKDVCWCEGLVPFTFDVTGKASDSCTQEIEVCTPWNAKATFFAVEPDIKMEPTTEVNSVIYPAEKFTKEIWVSDIVEMMSLHFDLRWTKYGDVNAIKLETVEFDKANLPHLSVSDWKATEEDGYWKLIVDIELKPTALPLRGTFRVLTLTFKKLDPWPKGAQPKYTYEEPHEWTPENATVEFWMHKGWFDTTCGNIYFGEAFDTDEIPDGSGDPLGKLVTSITDLPDYESYATADWALQTCDTGASANLTTYVKGDWAAVGTPIDNIPIEDINKIWFTYKNNYDPYDPITFDGTVGGEYTNIHLIPASGEYAYWDFDCDYLYMGINYDPTALPLGTDYLEFFVLNKNNGYPYCFRYNQDGTKGYKYYTTTWSILDTASKPWYDFKKGPHTELRVDLSAFGYTVGDTVKIAFKQRFSGSNRVYPSGLDPTDASTFKDYNLVDFHDSLLPGPRLALAINCTGEAWDDILVSESAPPCATDCTEWLVTGSWDYYNVPSAYGLNDTMLGLLEAGNTSLVTYGASWSDWPTVQSKYKAHNGNVTFAAIFVGSLTSDMGTGSSVVDLLKMEIEYPGPGGDYNITKDFEPPCMTDAYWDADLYDLEQRYIVNLYTFMPVPGDLNRDGVVNIVDVLIIAQQYGTDNPYYDFDEDGDVDIFDIVVITKNFNRASP